jgi:hypothetical protein
MLLTISNCNILLAEIQIEPSSSAKMIALNKQLHLFHSSADNRRLFLTNGLICLFHVGTHGSTLLVMSTNELKL